MSFYCGGKKTPPFSFSLSSREERRLFHAIFVVGSAASLLSIHMKYMNLFCHLPSNEKKSKKLQKNNNTLLEQVAAQLGAEFQ